MIALVRRVRSRQPRGRRSPESSGSCLIACDCSTSPGRSVYLPNGPPDAATLHAGLLGGHPACHVIIRCHHTCMNFFTEYLLDRVGFRLHNRVTSGGLRYRCQASASNGAIVLHCRCTLRSHRSARRFPGVAASAIGSLQCTVPIGRISVSSE